MYQSGAFEIWVNDSKPSVKIVDFRDVIILPDLLRIHQSRDLTVIREKIDFVVKLPTEVIWFPWPIYDRGVREGANRVHPTTMMEILILRDGGFQYLDYSCWALKNDSAADFVYSLRLWDRFGVRGHSPKIV